MLDDNLGSTLSIGIEKGWFIELGAVMFQYTMDVFELQQL